MSSVQFSADEILRMAEEIERSGQRFYCDAAARAEDERVRGVLLGLAAMEREHEAAFAALRGDLAQEAERYGVPVSFDPDLEVAGYLQALVEGKVFTRQDDPLEGRTSMEDILLRALAMEKESIIFYLGLKEALGRREGQAGNILERIIREEMEHVAALSKELAILRRA